MKSINAKNVKLTKAEEQRQFKQKIKTAKKNRISQHDESAAGAVQTTDEEIQKEIDTKIKERVRFQHKLREQYLLCMYLNTELTELRDVYNSYDKPTYGKYETDTGEIIEGEWLMKKDDKGNLLYGYIHTTDGRDIKLNAGWKVIRWVNQGKVTKQVDESRIPKTKYGVIYSKELLRWEYEIKEHQFGEAVTQLNYSISEITKLGFNKKQIEDIKYRGKYITDGDKLTKMEEDWLKKNIDYSEED